MITFSRSGNKVQLKVEYRSGSINTNICLFWDCGNEICAEATTRQLQSHYEKSIEREIKTAYEAGYKAGRQKKAKRTWFHDWITHINESLPHWKKED